MMFLFPVFYCMMYKESVYLAQPQVGTLSTGPLPSWIDGKCDNV